MNVKNENIDIDMVDSILCSGISVDSSFASNKNYNYYNSAIKRKQEIQCI